ncbi:hypothetical protein GGI43DRAFT_207949 [Trichoderma evansii]
MPFVEDCAMGWEECGDLIKTDVRSLERAMREGKQLALGDSFPIRSLISTLNGYGPSVERRIEEMHRVSEEFRLAVCLEHSVSLVVSSLIQLYYRDGDLVYELDEQATDIKVAQSILGTLTTFIGSYPSHFREYGRKYEAVRRGCDAIYLGWHDQRARKPEAVREVVLEGIIMEPGVVRDMGTQLTKIRTMIKTGNMSPGL